MARKAAKAANKHVEPEDESQDVDTLEGLDTEARGKAMTEGGKAVSKAEAIRRALAEGIESPEEGTDFIRRQYGLEVSRQHFSASKSQIKSKENEADSTPKPEPARRGRKPKSAGQGVEGYLAPPPKQQNVGESDIMLALESVKGLVERFGADKLKRMVDLLG